MGKSMRLIAFDLDNTLAKLNRPASRSTVEALLDFERNGIKIAIISGKPTNYLCGFIRQMGLEDAIISGENGMAIQYGTKFPPSHSFFSIEIDIQTIEALRTFELILRKRFGRHVWIQPNIVNLTAFPVLIEKKHDLFEFFQGYVEENRLQFKGFKVYKHVDAIELVPLSVDKGVALKRIMNIEKLGKNQVGAVGDSENDAPMFEQVENSFGIELDFVKYRVKSIEDAIRKIKKLLKLT